MTTMHRLLLSVPADPTSLEDVARMYERVVAALGGRGAQCDLHVALAASGDVPGVAPPGLAAMSMIVAGQPRHLIAVARLAAGPGVTVELADPWRLAVFRLHALGVHDLSGWPEAISRLLAAPVRPRRFIWSLAVRAKCDPLWHAHVKAAFAELGALPDPDIAQTSAV